MKKLAVLTSGGDSPGMNAAIRAVTRYALYCGYKVYGVERGYIGLINDEIFEMHSRSVSDVIHRGGTILKTGRCPEFMDSAYVKKAGENLLNREISNLIVIGGDGSYRGANELAKLCDVNVVGLPGTIDNDLSYTDFTIGFDTAVNTVLDAVSKVRDTMTSHDRVMMIEVMGRACGDIALYAAISGGAEYVITPEHPVDVEALAEGIRESSKRGKTSNLIILAEGCTAVRDEISRVVAEKVGKNVHYTKLGYIQRGGTPSNFDRILSARLGVRAVDAISKGENAVAIGIKNDAVVAVPFEDVFKTPRRDNSELYRIANILSL